MPLDDRPLVVLVVLVFREALLLPLLGLVLLLLFT